MSKTLPPATDVIVVGAGNAAFCAALAAAEQGVSVLMLERAPEAEAGGNSRFTAGAFRCVYNGVDDLRALMPNLTDDEVAKSDFQFGPPPDAVSFQTPPPSLLDATGNYPLPLPGVTKFAL